MLDRWRAYRQRQRAALLASNRASVRDEADRRDEPREHDVIADTLLRGGAAPGADEADRSRTGDRAGDRADDRADERTGDRTGDDAAGMSAAGETRGEDSSRPPFGTAGRPLNRHSPFYVGFVGALGVMVAISLYRTVGRLTEVFTLLAVAFFLTLALNPLVEALTGRGLRRSLSVSAVFLGLVVVFTVLGLIVIPPVATQGTRLVDSAPGALQSLLENQWVHDLDSHYRVVDKVQQELQKRVTDGSIVGGIFGGVLGAGKALASGFFSFFTVLVLTLYFLASLPKVKHAAYSALPASRRARVVSLSEEMMRRVGSYAIGQVAVATINALASWVMMTIVGIDYAAVLAVAVGFLGLIPMVGATFGAALVCLVALFDDPRKAIIALAYYVLYQQIENYVIAPRIMQRTVSVPGGVTVVAALAGATLLGVLGALLAIPVAAGLLLLYEEVLIPRQRHV